MKTLCALAGVCMSLHAFTASAETPALDEVRYSASYYILDRRPRR